MSRTTIKDIARLLQVNVSTVSRALSNHPNVLAETRQRVQELADELGYVPNQLAANLRRRHSRLIALILADMNMFFLPSVILAVEEQVRQNGYQLIILQSNNDFTLEKQNLQICLQLAVEGVLMALTSQTPGIAHFSNFLAQGIPVVFFDKAPPGKEQNTVTIDDEAAAYLAVRHLIERGHQRIFGLFGSKNLHMTDERLAGYHRALADAGLAMQEDWTIFAENSATARERLTALLLLEPMPAALFAMSDELLVGAVQAVEQLGRRFPQDLAIISMSDGFAPEFYNPKITHILHSGYKIGKAAWGLLYQRIQQPDDPHTYQIKINCPLIELKSV